MEDFHPATCIDCCKRLIDSRRRAPEFVEEFLYQAGQVGHLLLMTAGTLALGPAMLVSWMMDGGKSESERDDDLTFRYWEELPGAHLTDEERQIMHNFRTKLEVLEHRWKFARPNEKQDLRREIEELQTSYDEYRDRLESVHHEYAKRMMELARIESEMDAITRKREPHWTELDRLAHLEDRWYTVSHEAEMYRP